MDKAIASLMGRRRLLSIWVVGITAGILAACATERRSRSALMTTNRQQKQNRQAAEKGRLLARVTPPTETGALGLQPLGLSAKRDGFIYVPKGYQASRPAPLVLMLHGAGGDAEGGLVPFRQLADAAGLILLALDSRRQTWDVIFGQYGPDIAFIDQALTQAFSRYAVDPTRLAVEGFSTVPPMHSVLASPTATCSAMSLPSRQGLWHQEDKRVHHAYSSLTARMTRSYQLSDVVARLCRRCNVLVTTCFIGSSTDPTLFHRQSPTTHWTGSWQRGNEGFLTDAAQDRLLQNLLNAAKSRSTSAQRERLCGSVRSAFFR
jgi:hypothetical protein